MKKYLTFFLFLLLIGVTLSNIYVPKVKAVPTISYAYPTITISGFTIGTPCTFYDVYVASVNGGWFMAYSTGASQYTYAFLNDFTLSSGYFRDTNMNIFFNTSWASTNDRFTIQNGANLTLGTLTDNITKRTTDGVNIISGASSGGGIIDVDSGGILELYGCHLTTLAPDTIEIQGNATIYETTLTNIGIAFGANYAKETDVYRMNLEGTATGINQPTVTPIFDDLLIHSTTEALSVAGTNSPTFLNLIGRNNTYTVRTAFYSGDLYLINPDIDNYAFNYIVSPNGEIHRQYLFNLLVTYPNGTAINGTETGAIVEIQHYGFNSGVDYNATLNEDGTINETALTMGIYKQSSGDTINNCNPFNLRIYNVTGFNEYNGNFTLNIEQDLTISLTPQDFILPIALLIGCSVLIMLLIVAIWKKRR